MGDAATAEERHREASGRSRVLLVGLVVVAALAVAGLGAGAGILAWNGGGHQLTVNTPQTGDLAAPQMDTLTVVGHAEVRATPDRALVQLGVSVTKGGVHDAMSAANGDMQKLLDAVKGAGVAEQEIRTTTISVSQNWNCCPQTLAGFTAEQWISAGGITPDVAGKVIGAAVDAVGNDLRLGGLTLSLSDGSAQLTAARASAVADATSRAQQWAADAKRGVGAISAISEVVQGEQGVSPCLSGGCGGGGAQIQPGQTTIAVNVTVVFQLT